MYSEDGEDIATPKVKFLEQHQDIYLLSAVARSGIHNSSINVMAFLVEDTIKTPRISEGDKSKSP